MKLLKLLTSNEKMQHLTSLPPDSALCISNKGMFLQTLIALFMFPFLLERDAHLEVQQTSCVDRVFFVISSSVKCKCNVKWILGTEQWPSRTGG